MKISQGKKLELREAGRCPECFGYLGKLETFSWLSIGYVAVKPYEPYCPNCHVSYPDNLRVVTYQNAMTDQQITKIAQGINGSVSAFELRDRLGWICGLTDNDMVSELGLIVSRIAQDVWDSKARK